MTKKYDLIVIGGTPRSGTSLLAKVLSDLGLKLGKSTKMKYDSNKKRVPTGYMENKSILKALGIFNEVDRIGFNRIFHKLVYRSILRSIGINIIKKNLKNVDCVKHPFLVNYLHFFIEVLPVNPNILIIDLQRDIKKVYYSLINMPTLYDFYCFHTSYYLWKKQCKELKTNMDYYKSVFPNVTIKFDDLIENKQGWARDLSKKTGILEDKFYLSLSKFLIKSQ